MNEKNEDFHERRKYVRITKNFVLTYNVAKKPNDKKNISQLKNISMGGMCFITEEQFDPGTELSIELKTPYLSGTTKLEGIVLESHEKVSKILYETRLQFNDLSTDAEYVLKEMIDFFVSGDKQTYE